MIEPYRLSGALQLKATNCNTNDESLHHWMKAFRWAASIDVILITVCPLLGLQRVTTTAGEEHSARHPQVQNKVCTDTDQKASQRSEQKDSSREIFWGLKLNCSIHRARCCFSPEMLAAWCARTHTHAHWSYCHLAVRAVISLGHTAYYPVACLIMTLGFDAS